MGATAAQLQDLKGAQGKVPAAWEVRNKHFKIGNATPTLAEGMALAVVEGKGLVAMGINKDPQFKVRPPRQSARN